MKKLFASRLPVPVMTLFVGLFIILTGFHHNPLPGKIMGKITDSASGKGIPYGSVALMNKENKLLAQVFADGDGNFLIKQVVPGTYQCEAKSAGYTVKTIRQVIVVEGKTTTLNITLNAAMKTTAEKTKAHKLSPPVVKETRNEAIMQEDVSSYIKNMQSQPATGSTTYHNMGDQGFNREGYDYIAENEFNPAQEIPLSTFSIDVDRASYANVRRFINQGALPPADAVRVEELINYFSYQYPQPKDEHPFSISTEMVSCPWNTGHQLALIGIQGRKMETENLPSANLVFLIDVSGSMRSENKLPLLKKSLTLLVNNLRDQDQVALTVYAGQAGLVLPSTSGKYKEKILAAINNLEAGGSTAGAAGINLAYDEAAKNFESAGNNRVILATDGDFNVGVSSDGELVRLIEEKRKSGIYLTILGFGTGNYQDAKMEKLADKGNGNYAYIDNIMEAQKTLVNEMGGTLLTIAKDVKLQVEFNPEQVKEYKLIGYENRLLKDRDFNDDTKDAGELGEGHTVTALYEIVPVNEASTGVTVDPLKYQLKNLNNGQGYNNDLFTVKFRYKNPDNDKSKLMIQVVKNNSKGLRNASENIRFASSVAAFGMLLRNSKFKGDASYNMVLKLAEESKGNDVNGYRSEFIRLVETARILDRSTAKD